MKIAIEVVNGKVTAVHSDYNGEAEVKIYEDLDSSKLTDEELEAREMFPLTRNRVVSKSLKAYASMVSSADKGGVRIIE